jgi:hypothetical protein
MTLDKKQIVRQAYKIAENKDLERWVVPRPVQGPNGPAAR